MRRKLLGAMLGAGVLFTLAEGCGSEGGSGFDDPADAGGTSSSGGGQSSGQSGSGGTIGGSSGAGGDGGGSSSGAAACATATSKAERQPVYLDIILDGSGSMDAEVYPAFENDLGVCAPNTYQRIDYALGYGWYGVCRHVDFSEPDSEQPGRYTGKKWIAARGALEAYFAASAAVPSNNLGVGLYLFSSTNPGAEPVKVLDAVHAATLATRIRPSTFPLGRTPIRASLQSQNEYLRSFAVAPPLAPNGRRVILLITDGVPSGPDGDNSETAANVRAEVQAGLDGTPKVETAVIGVGNPSEDPNSFNETFLSALAKLGGLSPAGCKENWSDGDPETPCHLQVTPGAKTADQIKDEMIAAINAVAGSVASCNLTLDKSSPIDPAKVNVVYVDGNGVETQLTQDPANGWTYDNPADPGQVILHGTACDRLQSENGAVNIIVGCPTGTTVVN